MSNEHNLRRLANILEGYSDEDVSNARKLLRVEEILIDRMIGMMRGRNDTVFKMLSNEQRKGATLIVQWLIGNNLIDINKVDMNYCRTQTTVGI